MQVGVMVGPERGDTARQVARMLDDIAWAEAAGLAAAWIPQIPNDMDALLCVALLGAHTERIELGTAVVPLQAQHPVALARQALSGPGQGRIDVENETFTVHNPFDVAPVARCGSSSRRSARSC
jgi:Luciferase-like monooxygenase